jgi:hypothetical protein
MVASQKFALCSEIGRSRGIAILGGLFPSYPPVGGRDAERGGVWDEGEITCEEGPRRFVEVGLELDEGNVFWIRILGVRSVEGEVRVMCGIG